MISNIYESTISGVFVGELEIFDDDRGVFFEFFKSSEFETNFGNEFKVSQVNCSISKRGVLRGIHFAKNPPGQGKYVSCVTGSVFDVFVDLRKNSPTFGRWDSVYLNSNRPQIVYIPSGIGHAFLSLENQSTFFYLCDKNYNPSNEFAINPFDKQLNISWPAGFEIQLSKKDQQAQSFNEVQKILI